MEDFLSRGPARLVSHESVLESAGKSQTSQGALVSVYESHDDNGHIRTRTNDAKAFGLLPRLPRLVAERDNNSLGKRTQALTDIGSDSCP